MKDYLKISDEEERNFELWAFGPSSILYKEDSIWSWNCRHGDILLIEGHHDIKESLEKMYCLYRKHISENCISEIKDSKS